MSKMSNLFDQDNMFFTIMGVLFDLIILNVLTLLCCIPIVTAGASFTAMHNEAGFEARKTHTLMALHTAGPFCCRPQGVRQRNEDCNKRIEERRYRRMLGAGST